MNCFDEIIKHIYLLNEEYTIIYIAVGSSAGSVEHDLNNDTWKIKPQFEQQFPPFLSTLKMHNYAFPTHIILIDSLLEDPPFVICNSKKCVSDEWCKNEIWYHNVITNTYIYPIRTNVTYTPFENKDQLNIDDFLQQINLYAMNKNWFVVFHDFCGRDVGKLAEHFDGMIEGHHDHIIYGIGARLDGGCFIDLTLPECQFEYIIDLKGISYQNGIRAFNPYQYKFRELEQIYNNSSSNVVKSQICVMRDNIKNFFKNNFFVLVRQIALIKNGKQIPIYEPLYLHIESLYMVGIKEGLEKGESARLLEAVLNILQLELEKYVDNEIVSNAIRKMLEEPDFYKWNYHLEKIFDMNLIL